MGKKKTYPDEDLRVAQSIVDSPRGSMKKAAQFLDCSPNTAKTKLLEYQNKQLSNCQIQGRKVIPILEKPRKKA